MTSPYTYSSNTDAGAAGTDDPVLALLGDGADTRALRGLPVDYDPAVGGDPKSSYSGYAAGYVPFNVPGQQNPLVPPPVGLPQGQGDKFRAAAPGRDNVKKQDAFGREREHRPLQEDDYDKESKGDGGTVTYYSQAERSEFQVSIGALNTWTVSGLPIDTKRIFDTACKAFPKKVGTANWGQGLRPPADYINRALIWVCAPGDKGESTFYSNACLIGDVHHSSFSVDKQVLGAGEWVIIEGKLKYISPNSGHFRPDIATFFNAVLHMSRAFLADTQVIMYDTKTGAYVGRPVTEFIAKPADGGRYKVHVNS